MAVSVLRLQEGRGVSPGTSGIHDTLSLPLPLLASVYSGVYAVARGAAEELLESPRADLLSMARNPGPAASLKAAAAAAAASAGGEAVATGE